jgi:hypothetical protein
MIKQTFFAIAFLTGLAGLASFTAFAAEPPEFKWKAVEIDKIQVGYGLQLTDVNGDGKTDIVLADKKTFQWYEAPNWTKHIIAKNLTKRDNVCITARDINGDGKAEIAVGGQWNFSETLKDGAVFYLIPPKDRTKMWEPVKLYNDPSTHRMHWFKSGPGPKDFKLAVKPLRGKGTKNGKGPGLRVLAYTPPENPKDEWKTEVISDFMHLSHNFHTVNWDDDPEEEMINAGLEGVWHFDFKDGKWNKRQLTKEWAGEIRDGKLPNGKRFIVTVEPMHGTTASVYVQPDNDDGKTLWTPLAKVDESLKDGHALAVADFLGVGSDQIVVGWRAMNTRGVPGVKLFTPMDPDGKKWRQTRISAEKVAVEDIKAADLNGDGKIDIVAAARQTKNLTIFFNETK